MWDCVCANTLNKTLWIEFNLCCVVIFWFLENLFHLSKLPNWFNSGVQRLFDAFLAHSNGNILFFCVSKRVLNYDATGIFFLSLLHHRKKGCSRFELKFQVRVSISLKLFKILMAMQRTCYFSLFIDKTVKNDNETRIHQINTLTIRKAFVL